jgi:hypothetical protein
MMHPDHAAIVRMLLLAAGAAISARFVFIAGAMIYDAMRWGL